MLHSTWYLQLEVEKVCLARNNTKYNLMKQRQETQFGSLQSRDGGFSFLTTNKSI